MYRKIYSHANSIRVMMMMMMNIGERPTVILYTNINHHVGTSKQKYSSYSIQYQVYSTFGLRVPDCACVFFPFILLDIKFVGRTSRGHTGGRSHGISHPPSFCGACLTFSREKDSAIPFPRRL